MKADILTPGEVAPNFEMDDLHGQRVHLSDYRGKQPVVLAFLRGFM